MASKDLIKEFCRDYLTWMGDGGPDDFDLLFKREIESGKIKSWDECSSDEEREQLRQEYCIRKCLEYLIPKKRQKLQEIWSAATMQLARNRALIRECAFYLNELKKLAEKKNFVYEDTYKENDLFRLEMPKDSEEKVPVDEDLVISYIETALFRERDTRFIERLQKVLDLYNEVTSIGEKNARESI